MLVAPDLLIAILAAWLGVSVITRTPREYAARVFAWATLLLTLYGTSRMVGQLTSSEAVVRGAGRVEYATNSLLPAALLHITLVVTGDRRLNAVQRAVLVAAYIAGAAAAIVFALTGVRGLSTAAVGRTAFGLREAPLAWAWVVFRVLVMGLASWWAWGAWHTASRGSTQKSQLGAVLGAVLVGAVGGVLTIAGAQLGSAEWPGLALVAVSMVLAAYAVLGRQLFLARATARRSLYASVSAALLAAGYVGVLLGLERLSRQVLHVETPLVTALALVLTIVLFDPVRERLRELLDRGPARREVVYRRLLRAMGDELMTSQKPEAAIEPALTQLCTSLGVSTARVVAGDGRTLATFGPDAVQDVSAPVRLPVRAGGTEYGVLICGPRRTRLPYTSAEVELLDDAAGFIGASLQLAERQTTEAAALEKLAQERAALHAQEAALAHALSDPAARSAARGGLHVFALGPLRVERNGEAIRQWGGPKAGTRQAQAIFAFLYDRGEHGVMKDEFIEVIWPDVPLDKADLAFHRTLGGLRRILEPDLRSGDATAITFRNDRYYLALDLIAWSDVEAFRARIAEAGTSPEPIAMLEEARALYRGDYLLDCPFYGDSPYVQERRALLRGRFVDVLLALGERYEAQEDRPAAAACFREALQVSGDDCPRADDGLARLGLPLLEP